MTDETPAKRGDAAWKAECDEISRRNADAHRRALDAKKTRAASVAASARVELDREARQLRAINERLEKQRARAAR